MEEAKQLVKTITKGIQDKKGSDIVVVNLSNIEGSIANYFVICQGNSPTQVEAIARSVGEHVRKDMDEKPTNVIGLNTAQWVAIDYSNVLVHIFLPDTRSFYDLEGLWEDANLTRIPNID